MMAMKQVKDAYEVYDLERLVLRKSNGESGLRSNRTEVRSGGKENIA